MDAVPRGDDPGIPQGNNHSPCALNAALHDWLDQLVMSSVVHPLWFQCADNLCYRCQGVPKGEQVAGADRRRPLDGSW